MRGSEVKLGKVMMKYRIIKRISVMLLAALVLASCSTTKKLAAGQVLYDGIEKLNIINQSETATGQEAVAEVKAALEKAPNNSWFGSAYSRHFFPLGLWAYNSLLDSRGSLKKWLFKKLAAKPIYISTVNPELRTKVATNLLRDYGFFNGTVSYTILPDAKNDKMAKITYNVDMRNPYFLDSIAYYNFPELTELSAGARRRAPQQRSLLKKGDQFNVIDLEDERQRISTLLRNRGYYFFRSDFIGYQADTTRTSGLVDLRIQPKPGVPAAARRQWYIGDIAVQLFGVNGEVPTDSLHYKGITIHYHNKLKVRPRVLHNRIRIKSGDLYSQRRSAATQERLAELGIFRYSEMQFIPSDTTETNNLLNLNISSAFDLPYDSQFELNLATKSNDYAGPGLAYTVTKRNIFRGGETFTVGVKGSYEWQTKSAAGGGAKVNSYEFGANTALMFPRILFPWLGSREWNFPATTTFKLNADWLNRARFFRMLSFGGEATYTFQPTLTTRHSITPFRLTFNVLQSKTEEFNNILEENRALARSMEDQFIPAMSYTYTYDTSTNRRRRNRFWWQTTITSAGNITSAAAAVLGKGFDEEKTWMNSRMAQFVKLTSELRYTWVIDRNQSIATRVMAGMVYAYGSNKYAPYSEQFFIGGANSIRAFTVRTVGPGTYSPAERDKYSYLDQTGDIKFEANVEYRFRIVQDLHGAFFLDAGNIWLMRDDEDGKRKGGKFTLNNFGNNIAVGTGAGLRYDLSFLVIRFDCGVALHVPYETTKSGYYNIPKFKDGLGWHLAIGYPF